MPSEEFAEKASENVLVRIFGKLEALMVDGATNTANLKSIKEQMEGLGDRTRNVEANIASVAATVQSHSPFFQQIGDVDKRLADIEHTCAARSAFPPRVEALEKKVEALKVAQAAGASERTTDQKWWDRMWPLLKVVLYIIGGIALYNAKAFFDGGKIVP